ELRQRVHEAVLVEWVIGGTRSRCDACGHTTVASRQGYNWCKWSACNFCSRHVGLFLACAWTQIPDGLGAASGATPAITGRLSRGACETCAAATRPAASCLPLSSSACASP